jgi:tellurite resistance protein
MSRHLRFPVALLILIVLAGAMLSFGAPFAWGRAGGGESYGGGGGGGSGGGGGGDGDGLGWLIYILIRLLFEYPAIGVPVLIVVIVIAVYAGNSTHSGYMTRTIRRGEALQAASARERALAQLRSNDPQFDEQKFLNRVSGAFLKIQEAWSRQDLAAVRPFISDGIRERFSVQFEMQKALGYRNQLDRVQVLGARTAAIVSDATFDTIDVEFRAAADDYRVELSTGRRGGSPPVPDEFVEYWSFHRRPGAQSLAHPGALEGHCPHCGSPLEIVDVAKCSSCQSIVNSGEHDWVLAEITQAQEWHVPEDEASVPGLAHLKSADPAFCSQHVEDRVSVMFWRLRAAEFFGNSRRVAPIASAKFAGEFSRITSDVSPNPTPMGSVAPRRFYQDAAVGKVALAEVIGDPAEEIDRLRVVVRWSGIPCEGDPRRSNRAVGGKSIRTQVFELMRRQGVKSRADSTFSSASCPSCGAPIAASSEAACGFCGTSLTDGRFDWVLDAVGPWSPRAAFAPAQPAGVAQRARRAARGELSLATLARIAAADGQIDDDERKLLMDVGARRGLSPEQVQTVMNTAQTDDGEVPVPGNPREAGDYLREMVAASLADGNISGQEQRLLIGYARRMNLSEADVRLEIARQRKERFQASKSALRQAKRGTA